ncbi:MAG: dTDP-4-dehydrorhamnose reductase [Candidatus Omnitrophota bacterium]|nr:MAG: dTDP-4-dehydrorhamnose reductase [Candidatus Omnitrophota bacterium]
MKILITGSSGMLAAALIRQLSDKYEVAGLDISKVQNTNYKLQKFIECDITDGKKTLGAISSCGVDIVIHTAAYTDVDGCEKNPQEAEKVNALGTKNVARAAKDCNCLLIYISTDFVFDGEKKTPYTEEDKPHPINAYGKAKLDGERLVQSILKDFIIVRSSWLFGAGGRNFVDTILNKAKSEKRIKVVNDQFGSPTYAFDLAMAIKALLPAFKPSGDIYHITNSGSCSWYEFARAIKEIAGLDTNILPVSASEYNSPAARPRMSILENGRYRDRTGGNLRPWREALGEYLKG